jgi:hypothetical protein
MSGQCNAKLSVLKTFWECSILSSNLFWKVCDHHFYTKMYMFFSDDIAHNGYIFCLKLHTFRRNSVICISYPSQRNAVVYKTLRKKYCLCGNSIAANTIIMQATQVQIHSETGLFNLVIFLRWYIFLLYEEMEIYHIPVQFIAKTLIILFHTQWGCQNPCSFSIFIHNPPYIFMWILLI